MTISWWKKYVFSNLTKMLLHFKRTIYPVSWLSLTYFHDPVVKYSSKYSSRMKSRLNIYLCSCHSNLVLIIYYWRYVQTYLGTLNILAPVPSWKIQFPKFKITHVSESVSANEIWHLWRHWIVLTITYSYSPSYLMKAGDSFNISGLFVGIRCSRQSDINIMTEIWNGMINKESALGAHHPSSFPPL